MPGACTGRAISSRKKSNIEIPSPFFMIPMEPGAMRLDGHVFPKEELLNLMPDEVYGKIAALLSRNCATRD
jgi:hypothetical protein